MRIEDNINELLLDHDLVIVPQFGGFLASYAGARLDEQRQLIHPPGWVVAFNKDLVRDDGLLTDHVADKAGVPFPQAKAVVSSVVHNWQDKLGKAGRLDLERIGVFYQDQESNLQFQPHRGELHSKEAFGLKPVPAVPVRKDQERTTPKVIPMPPITPEAEEHDQPRRNEVMWAAAATAALVLGFCSWLLWQSDINMGQQQFTNLLPDAEKVQTKYVERDPVTAEERVEETTLTPIQFDDAERGFHTMDLTGANSQVLVDLGKEEVEEPPVVVEEAPKDELAMPLRFHVVGGCFSEKDNADRFLARTKAKGYPARHIDHHRGLHRIAYSSHARRAEALHALAEVRRDDAPDAWLLIK